MSCYPRFDRQCQKKFFCLKRKNGNRIKEQILAKKKIILKGTQDQFGSACGIPIWYSGCFRCHRVRGSNPTALNFSLHIPQSITVRAVNIKQKGDFKMMIVCTMLSTKTKQLNASTDVHNLLMQMYLECNFKAI